MEILITNDDGWGSKGLMRLVKSLMPLGHITVLAPEGVRSGMSNAISSHTQMTLHHEKTPKDMQGVEIYTTNGTPSDCIKLAINVLFKEDVKKIDLVVSGINHGSNAAIDIIYSGTMGACFVAAEQGIPAIGFSIYDMDPDADFSYMEPYLLPLTKELYAKGMPRTVCYNINAPKGEIKGVKNTRQCISHWEKEIRETELDNGETAYTLTGYLVNDEPDAEDTDEWALMHGYLSIQACSVDMTYYGEMG
ncbi:MAG: 5'/3'-nucleotidase SurE [Paludibacteraceae bacterium]|nr:5'/3'-nucleotidase SurE [Paludibacteraceae bacterium]